MRGPAVSRVSLITDLANVHDHVARWARDNTRLQKRLSELLGEQAWRESGLGASRDVDELHRRITELTQECAELRGQLGDRDDDLDAARATNRELMTASTVQPIRSPITRSSIPMPLGGHGSNP
ncbi:MAG: hypothetical protein M3Y73_10245 [Actinomycetota bacterium]|nr:hypothetical protein [Actinomycetota bacterium]